MVTNHASWWGFFHLNIILLYKIIMETQTVAERYYACLKKATKKYYETHREELLAKRREHYAKMKAKALENNEVNPHTVEVRLQREKAREEAIANGTYRPRGRPAGARTKPLEELTPTQRKNREAYERRRQEAIANGTYRPRGRPPKVEGGGSSKVV